MTADDAEKSALQRAFDASNAIVDLKGLPFTDAMRRRQERIIASEITFDEAVAEVKREYIKSA